MEENKVLAGIVKEHTNKLNLPETVFNYMVDVISEDLPTVTPFKFF